MPIAIELDELGCLVRDVHPDGTQTGVQPLLYGGRISRGPTDRPWWDEHWAYPSLQTALIAYACWEQAEQSEPEGWTRHMPSGRRQPSPP